MNRRKRSAVNTGPTTADRPRRPWAIVVAVIIVDQLTKLLAPAFVPIVKNTGTVFGIFGQNNRFFTILSIIIVLLILYAIFKAKPAVTKKARIMQAAAMLIVGGGISNILDRLFHGYVIDFISVPFWPTFNVADMCVTIGVTILIWQSFFVKDEEEPALETAEVS